MKRFLAAVAIATVAIVTACGSDAPEDPAAAPGNSAAAAAPSPARPDGVPGVQGDPADLSAPVQALAGGDAAPAGLLTQDLVVGSGPAATLADTVAVRYTGTRYTDGGVFDSSWQRGDRPAVFPLNRVVPGFAQGIAGMQPGGRRVIVIPPDLGYGDASPSPDIPPGSTLVFVVDLVQIT